MILGIGTDIVEVSRVERLTKHTDIYLRRVFSEQELHDCASPEIAMRLAARFAAKESFYKALSSTLVALGYTQNKFSFLSVCPLISVVYGPLNVPQLTVDWQALEQKACSVLPSLDVHLSISHEKTYALAFVVISKK